jgi:hypothetical protein
MPNPIDVGTGTSIAFQTTGFAAFIMGVDGPDQSRESIDTTHLGTTGSKTFRPGDLVDNGELSLDIAFDPDLTIPIAAAVETVVITFPVPAGKTTGAQWSFSAFCTGHSAAIPLEEKMTAKMTLKITGAITKTPSA